MKVTQEIYGCPQANDRTIVRQSVESAMPTGKPGHGSLGRGRLRAIATGFAALFGKTCGNTVRAIGRRRRAFYDIGMTAGRRSKRMFTKTGPIAVSAFARSTLS